MMGRMGQEKRNRCTQVWEGNERGMEKTKVNEKMGQRERVINEGRERGE